MKARIHTEGEDIHLEVGGHNHASIPWRAEVHQAIGKAKIQASSTGLSTREILASAVVGMPDAVLALMPPLVNISRTIRRVRASAPGDPPIPKTLRELVISDDFLFVDDTQRELFLLHDSGPSTKRLLVFSTAQNLRLLEKHQDWAMDGTFSCAPLNFLQLYTIHCMIGETFIPMVFALLPNKSFAAYQKLFSILKAKHPSLNPASISVDFEKAALNAIAKEFPGAVRRGCYFHFCQCIWRQIQSNGLTGRYQSDPEFASKLKLLPSLAFVPSADVTLAFDQLVSAANFPKVVTPLIEYFEKTWIGRIATTERRGGVSFPLEL